MTQIGTMIVCRSVANGLTPGSLTGYNCIVCNDPVQATPAGAKHIANGALPFCNDCGFKMAARLEEHHKLGNIVVGPEATKQLVRMMQKDAQNKKSN